MNSYFITLPTVQAELWFEVCKDCGLEVEIILSKAKPGYSRVYAEGAQQDLETAWRLFVEQYKIILE